MGLNVYVLSHMANIKRIRGHSILYCILLVAGDEERAEALSFISYLGMYSRFSHLTTRKANFTQTGCKYPIRYVVLELRF